MGNPILCGRSHWELKVSVALHFANQCTWFNANGNGIESRCTIDTDTGPSRIYFPVGKIAEKAVYRSVFLTIWHCILSAELTKTHSFRLFFCRFCPLGGVLNACKAGFPLVELCCKSFTYLDCMFLQNIKTIEFAVKM